MNRAFSFAFLFVKSMGLTFICQNQLEVSERVDGCLSEELLCPLLLEQLALGAWLAQESNFASSLCSSVRSGARDSKGQSAYPDSFTNRITQHAASKTSVYLSAFHFPGPPQNTNDQTSPSQTSRDTGHGTLPHLARPDTLAYAGSALMTSPHSD